MMIGEGDEAGEGKKKGGEDNGVTGFQGLHGSCDGGWAQGAKLIRLEGLHSSQQHHHHRWQHSHPVLLFRCSTLTADHQEENGGALVDVETGNRYLPEFNSLIAFKIPRYHAVSDGKETRGKFVTLLQVEPVRGSRPRYSIFGWFLTEGILYDLYRFSTPLLRLLLPHHRMLTRDQGGEDRGGEDEEEAGEEAAPPLEVLRSRSSS
eukprot:325198-Hanusia_phi.AAC.1